jgi:hypothetical protein
MLIKIGQFEKGLLDLVEGFLYQYRTFGLTRSDHASQATHAEIRYFYDLGIMLNMYATIEAKRDSKDKPADLIWTNKYPEIYYKEEDVVLHLERETRGWEGIKKKKTCEKLFDKSRKIPIPIGIAIIDNVPKKKIEDVIDLFSKAFKAKAKFKEFALIIYKQNKDQESKNKDIEVHIFGEKPDHRKAKFEFVGISENKENLEFVIVSYWVNLRSSRPCS